MPVAVSSHRLQLQRVPVQYSTVQYRYLYFTLLLFLIFFKPSPEGYFKIATLSTLTLAIMVVY